MTKLDFNLLVGGTSHVGKSVLCASLGAGLDCEVFSTDQMARHPGRPWPKVRPHVAEFYTAMSAHNIQTFLLHHHENMWPSIKSLVEHRLKAQNYCLIEGSALRPEYLAELTSPKNICICLFAPAELIKTRIHTNSNYSDLTAKSRHLVDVFIERSIKDNKANVQAAKQHAIELINVADQNALEDLRSKLIGNDNSQIMKASG